jgi:hypothetical protein
MRKRRKKTIRLLEKIKVDVSRGLGFNEIARLRGYSTPYIWKLAKEEGIEIPETPRIAQQHRKKPDRAKIYHSLGYNMTEVSRLTPVSRSGLYCRLSIRKENASENNKKEIYQALVLATADYVRKRAEKESWAMQKTVEYVLRRHRTYNPIPAEKLYKLLEAYHDAKESGTRLSMQKLSEMSGVDVFSVRRIFGVLGVEPLFGHKPCTKIPKEKKNATRRIYETDVSLVDVGYFLGVSHSVVKETLRKAYGKAGRRRQFIKRLGKLVGSEVLTYRVASQVYQAQDWGWSAEDIAYCFDGKERTVRYAIDHRREIEPMILKLLNRLYPNVRHRKPYLT